MEKKCLIFMPLGDPLGYSSGHFSRIFDYIILPACRSANFTAVRADATAEALKSVINADMVLCDFSGAVSDVRFGFAVRQALNLPVAIIKDAKTPVDYSLSEFTITEYDESLRIDIVQNAIDAVTNALRMRSTGEATLLKKLSIDPGLETGYGYTSTFTYSEPVQEIIAPTPSIPLPDFVGDILTEKDIEKLKAGDSIYHTTHGKGVITSIKMMAQDKMANVQFENGLKLLVLGTSGIFRKIIE